MRKRSLVKQFMLLLVCLILVMPVLLYSAHVVSYFTPVPGTILNDNDWEKLAGSSISRYKVIQYVRSHTPKESLFLVFRQSDFAYYAQRKLINQYDPRLLAFYKFNEKDHALQFLIKIGIDYIYIPDYMEPTLFNSKLFEIIADPSMSQLVYESGGYRLFKLHNKIIHVESRPVKLHEFHLSRPGKHFIPAWSHNLISFEKYSAGGHSESESDSNTYIVKNDDSRVYLYTGRGNIKLSPKECFYESEITSGGTYVFSAEIKGRGLARAYLASYFHNNGMQLIPVWNSLLTDHYRMIATQFQALPSADGYRIVFEIPKGAQLAMRRISLENVNDSFMKTAVEDDETDRRKEENMRWIPVFSWDLQSGDNKNDFEQMTYSENSDLKCPFAIMRDSQGGHRIVYMSSGYWLYLTKNYIMHSRISILDVYKMRVENYIDKLHRMLSGIHISDLLSDSRARDHLYRISVLLKGLGSANLYIWWYDRNGKRKKKEIARYFLPEEYKSINEVLSLPEDAENITVGFLLPELKDEPGTLYVKHLSVEKNL